MGINSIDWSGMLCGMPLVVQYQAPELALSDGSMNGTHRPARCLL